MFIYNSVTLSLSIIKLYQIILPTLTMHVSHPLPHSTAHKYRNKWSLEIKIMQKEMEHKCLPTIHMWRKNPKWNGTGWWETLMVQQGCTCSSDQAHWYFSVHACVSVQLVYHRPNVHPADNTWMEMELLWYDADGENTWETSPTTTIHNKMHMNCLWSKSRSPAWKTSEWVAEMWHRPGWLYHQWSCVTDLAGCITSGVVAQTWLTVSSVGLWHRLGWLYHQWSCGTDLADCITSWAVAQTCW